MTALELYRALNTICQLNIVDKNYIHIQVVLTIYPQDQSCLIKQIRKLEKLKFVSFDGEIISLTEQIVANIEERDS